MADNDYMVGVVHFRQICGVCKRDIYRKAVGYISITTALTKPVIEAMHTNQNRRAT